MHTELQAYRNGRSQWMWCLTAVARIFGCGSSIIISAIGRSLATVQSGEVARQLGRSYMPVRRVRCMLERDRAGKLSCQRSQHFSTFVLAMLEHTSDTILHHDALALNGSGPPTVCG